MMAVRTSASVLAALQKLTRALSSLVSHRSSASLLHRG
jgi:hypothetical protein